MPDVCISMARISLDRTRRDARGNRAVHYSPLSFPPLPFPLSISLFLGDPPRSHPPLCLFGPHSYATRKYAEQASERANARSHEVCVVNSIFSDSLAQT